MTAAEYRSLQGLPPAGAVASSPKLCERQQRASSKCRQRFAVAAPSELRTNYAEARAEPAKRKYRNEPVIFMGESFDSRKERQVYEKLVLLKDARDLQERVERIERQVWFEVIPKQPGERSSSYVADFVAYMVTGGRRVIDVKSDVTRKLATYVLKRKLMLQVHGVRIEEW
jgi:hypothetical protein